jgi:hypothetical protein
MPSWGSAFPGGDFYAELGLSVPGGRFLIFFEKNIKVAKKVAYCDV